MLSERNSVYLLKEKPNVNLVSQQECKILFMIIRCKSNMRSQLSDLLPTVTAVNQKCFVLSSKYFCIFLKSRLCPTWLLIHPQHSQSCCFRLICLQIRAFQHFPNLRHVFCSQNPNENAQYSDSSRTFAAHNIRQSANSL